MLNTHSTASEACFVSHYRHKQRRYRPFLQPFLLLRASQKATLLNQQCRAIQDPLQVRTRTPHLIKAIADHT